MKQRIVAFLLVSVLALTALSWDLIAETARPKASFDRFSRKELSVFDTEITLIGFAESQNAFNVAADQTMDILKKFDRIFDGYHAYEGLNNLYYLNRHAAQEPVQVPQELFDLVSWCKAQWDQGLRSTNVAMGAVLSIWHEYRDAGIASPETASLPPMEDLTAASRHVDFDKVILDSEKQTIFYSDPDLALDIGAVAKGWAADEAAKFLYQAMPSFLLSLGGNVYAGKAPMDGRSAWAVGVQDPRADGLQAAVGGTDILDIVDVSDLSVVTSGDYWRYYIVDGERYHHIIDPATLMPSKQMLSVTVVCESSVLADFLSTTFFVLSYEEGLRLAESLEGVEVMWVLPDNSILFTPGMAEYARSLKNTQEGVNGK